MSLIISVLAFSIPVLAALSCQKRESQKIEEETERTDSITLGFESSCMMRGIDCFVYSDVGVRSLLTHVSVEDGIPGMEKDVRIEAPQTAGDMTVVAIANFPGKFNLQALGSMDSMETLTMDYRLEDESFPVLCGVAPFDSAGRMKLEPMLCEIILVRAGQELGSLRRIENPRLFLGSVNLSVELLRRNGFRPVETANDTAGMRCPDLMFKFLPSDLGERDQFPDIHLFCYPNDDAEATIGTPRTEVTFEGELAGYARSWSMRLPALKKGTVIHLELDILPDGTCSWKSY